MQRRYPIFNLCLILLLALLPWNSYGDQDAKPFSQQEIEQMVAPIALYPDPLLAQILMASTYPLEIVSAARWVKANPNLKDKALEDALAQQTWDPSVKSLTAVPDVLNMLNDKLDMTTKLGDAFLGQQKEVLDAVQTLRAKAQNAGNLKSTKELVVKSEPVATESESTEPAQTYISIEPASPDVIYVPTYNPAIVYGDWPYPDYPPYSYYPESYYPVGALFAFGTAVAVGGALWGQFDWHNHDVNINVDRYNQFNRADINNGRWEHHVDHRGNVPYRDRASQERFAKDRVQDNKARDNFRDQAEQGRREISEGGKGAIQNMEREGQRREQRANDNKALGQGDRAGQNRPDKSAGQNRPDKSAGQNRPNKQPKQTAKRPTQNVNRGGQSARQQPSQRARSSQQPRRAQGSRPNRGSMGSGGGRRMSSGGGGRSMGGGGGRRSGGGGGRSGGGRRR